MALNLNRILFWNLPWLFWNTLNLFRIRNIRFFTKLNLLIYRYLHLFNASFFRMQEWFLNALYLLHLWVEIRARILLNPLIMSVFLRVLFSKFNSRFGKTFLSNSALKYRLKKNCLTFAAIGSDIVSLKEFPIAIRFVLSFFQSTPQILN